MNYRRVRAATTTAGRCGHFRDSDSPAESQSVQGSSISTSSQPSHTPSHTPSLHRSTISRSDLATNLPWKFRPPEFPRVRAKVTPPAHGQTESRICPRVANFRDSELSQPPRLFGAYHIFDRRSRGSHGALTPKTGTSSAVSLATVGSVPPSLTAKSGTGASLPAAGGPTARQEISTLKAHRQDLANLIKIWVANKRPSDESSECTSTRGDQALARTTSTHGTGPSRQRPTLANPEGGGLVRDGPAATDAGPLPRGREQGRCTRA